MPAQFVHVAQLTFCMRRVKLKAFHKFEDTAEAVQSATALVEGKLSAGMKKFLKKSIVSKELQVRRTPAEAPVVRRNTYAQGELAGHTCCG